MAFNQKELKNYIIANENCKPEVYDDSLGIPSVGVGFNLRRAGAKAKLTTLGINIEDVLDKTVTLQASQIDSLLNDDITSAIDFARNTFPDFDSLDATRSTVLLDMIFNMGGPRFLQFQKLIAAVNAKKWENAAAEMQDSKWFTQVGKRGLKNVEAMKTGMLPSVETDLRLIEKRNISKYGPSYRLENPPKMPKVELPKFEKQIFIRPILP